MTKHSPCAMHEVGEHCLPQNKLHNAMGKGKHWDTKENSLLARAFVHISTGSILGTDQTEKRFYSAVYSNFAERGREAFGSLSVPPGRYGLRSLDSCRQHFSDISADDQKFWRAVTTVNNASHTGATEEDNISMAIAIHFWQDPPYGLRLQMHGPDVLGQLSRLSCSQE
eukprot:IDg4661t1